VIIKGALSQLPMLFFAFCILPAMTYYIVKLGDNEGYYSYANQTSSFCKNLIMCIEKEIICQKEVKYF